MGSSGHPSQASSSRAERLQHDAAHTARLERAAAQSQKRTNASRKPRSHPKAEASWPNTTPRKWKPSGRRRWDAEGVFNADADPARPKYYLLEMLPYPSGTLHMGHMRNYTIGDAVARYRRMRGFNVLHPIGWDAFGLPAENAAIKRGTPPRDWTNANIAQMKAVCRRFGFSYDWRREISTCEPEYYRWNQWFFLRMLERGLAYRKRSLVNWCPKCQTVLANEQVDRRLLLAARRHARRSQGNRAVVSAHHAICRRACSKIWSNSKAAGPSACSSCSATGSANRAALACAFRSTSARAHQQAPQIEVFTTRVDTIFGAAAVILSPAHEILPDLFAGQSNRAKLEEEAARLRARIIRGADLATAEKEGFFTGRFATNPFSGEKVPIWVGNFVLAEYGTGAVMAVPAHDQRDFEFARKYKIPFPVVIQPLEGPPLQADQMKEAFTDYGRLVNSGPYTGLTSEAAIEKMTADAQAKGIGEAEITYRLKDWGISRQRYWGTPIPVIYCAQCGIVPVPDKDLPVRLPENVLLTGQGQSPLANVPSFVNVKCPKCGGPGRRETDTMDTFIDSSWYFFRYTDPHNDRAPFDPAAAALLVSHRSIYWRHRTRHPAPDLFALFLQGDARPEARGNPRARAAALFPGHGAERRRQNVQVQGQRRRRHRHGRKVRLRYRAHVHAFRRAAGKRSGMERAGN